MRFARLRLTFVPSPNRRPSGFGQRMRKMDTLVIANLSQRRTSSRIAGAWEEDRYYRAHQWSFRLPKLSAGSIAAFVGLFVVALERLPR
jgi:hypothetical protein